MANNFVKWWKTKFLNGYKQFSADSNHDRFSDTEELLGAETNHENLDRLKGSCTTPPLQAMKGKCEDNLHHLNVEEFSCDVSVEGGRDNNGQERQEFSFTLYDFDGHGKITKDDIAGLVTTIYETIGSSVKVPHYGSKTIKVKLTVSPDQRKHVSATVIGHKKKRADIQVGQDASPNAKICKCHRQRTGRDVKKHYCCRKLEEEQENIPVSDDYSDVCSRISDVLSSNEEEGDCPEEQFSSYKKRIGKRFRKHSGRHTNQVKDGGKSACARTKPAKKKNNRQELLEIIQNNMKKNNLSFQTSRKPRIEQMNVDNKQLIQVEPKLAKYHTKKVSKSPFRYLANMVDPTRFYVDLAALQNSSHFPEDSCHYHKLIDAVMSVSNRRKQGCSRNTKAREPCDIPFHYFTPNSESTPQLVRKNKRSEVDVKKVGTKKFPPVVVGHTSSPHHLRHRNRQQDQALAMAQVVRWLEQEFSSNKEPKSNYCSDKPEQTSTGIEHHEHHHIHEHIHHHYHHYQDSPLVL